MNSSVEIEKQHLNFKNIFDTYSDSVIIINKDFKILYLNNKAKDNIYRNGKETGSVGAEIFDYIEESRKAFFSETIEKCLQGDVIEYVHQYKGENGKIIYFRYSVNPINDAGEINSIIITGRDISDIKASEAKLVKSEGDYYYLFEKNPFALLIYSLDSYKILLSNSAATNLYGYSQEDFLDMTLYNLRSEHHFKRMEDALKNRTDDTGFAKGIWEHIKKNGEVVFVEISAMPFEYKNQIARLVMIHDITQKKIAEDKLNKLEISYQVLVNTIDGIVWQADANTLEFSFISQAVERILGYSVSEWLASPSFWADHIHPEDREEAILFCTESTKRKESHQFEYRMISADGSVVHIHENVSVIIENDKPVILRGIMSDITKRKEDELNNQFRAGLLNAIGQAAIATDENGYIVYWNKGAEQCYGWTENEALGKDFINLTPAAYTTDQTLDILNALQNGNSWSGEHLVKNKNGHEFPVFSICAPIFNAHSKMTGIIAVSSDITEKKKIENLIIKSEEKYRNLFEQNIAGFVEATISGEILNCNDAIARMLKYDSAQDLIGMNAADLYFSPQDRFTFINNVLDLKQLYNYEKTLKCRDGSPLYSLENISLQHDKLTGEKFCTSIIIDISELKLAEQKLKESNERFINVSRATFDAIWDWDIKTNNLFIGEGFEKLFGYHTNGNANFLTWAEHIHPEDKERVIRNRLDINRLDSNWQDDYRYLRADGSTAYVSDKGVLLKNGEGCYRMIGAMQDVTKWKNDSFALQQSEARLRGIIGSQTNYVVRTDLSGNYTYYNKKFNEDFGWVYRGADIIGTNAMLSIMSYHHQRVKETVEKCYNSLNEVFQVEMDKPARNGEVKTTLWDFICLTDEKGNPTEIQCTGIDISARKEAEMALVNSLQERNTILESIGDGFFALDNNWIVLYWNRHAEQWIGKTKEEVLGKKLWDVFPDRINSISYKKYHEAYENREIIQFDDFYQPTNKWYEMSVWPSEKGLLVYFKDITSRKEAEEAIRSSEEIRRLVIESAMDAIICFDTSGKITVWNPMAEKIFGWNDNEVSGEQLCDIIIPSHYRDSNTVGMKKYLPTGNEYKTEKPFEITALNKGGKEFPIELRVTCINQKESEFYCAFIRDITERKQAENNLNELNNNLRKQTIQLAHSNDELERYAYVTSHDLQEPLRMITSFLQLLKKKYDAQLDDTAQKYINFAVDGAERMKKLILDLLEFSRISSYEEDRKHIDLNNVIKSTKKALKLIIEESKTTITVSELPSVFGNESKMIQIFQNLISNAIKYKSNLNPDIHIGYTETDDEWQFYVQDNGIGIDTRYFERIFLIFQRLHKRKDYEGTGIGLAICKKIVEVHGGKIWVESEKNKGSTFYFTILKV